MREGYVDQNGNKIDQKELDKKKIRNILIVLGVILLIIVIYIIFKNITQKRFCNNIVDKVKEASLTYAKNENTLPANEGDYIQFSLDELFSTKLITKEDVTVNKKVATAAIKITKYKKDYITTVELKDCDYCDSSKKVWSKETKTKKNANVIDVTAYYNYYHKTENITDWSKWFLIKDLQENVSEKYNIRLPKNEETLPRIANDAKINVIEQETKDYFKYRDKKWKWYAGGGNYTDYFSSEQPEGYPNYDKNTMIYTEWSPYSLSYPEEKSYRKIETKTAYKWFKKEKGKNVYYKSGQYFTVEDVPEGYSRDTKQSTPVYHYRDQQWRWYNGTARKYSGYSTTMPRNYSSRDDGLVTYSGYSNFAETSSITPQNADYREEIRETRYRYRIRYDVYSLAVLKKPVVKKDLEENLKQTLDQIMVRPDLKVEVTYQFKYKK